MTTSTALVDTRARIKQLRLETLRRPPSRMAQLRHAFFLTLTIASLFIIEYVAAVKVAPASPHNGQELFTHMASSTGGLDTQPLPPQEALRSTKAPPQMSMQMSRNPRMEPLYSFVELGMMVGVPTNKTCDPTTQRWDCRVTEVCNEITKRCDYCSRDDQCTDFPAFDCKYAEGSSHNVCRHKSLLPNVSDVDVITSILAFIFCMMAGGGGVGGGSLLVPIFVVINRFLPQEAIPLSKATIFAGSIGNLILNVFKSHPYDHRRVLIDYETATVLEPIALYGTVVGVLFTRSFPEWFIFIALVSVLFLMSWKTIARAASLYRIETKESAMLEQARRRTDMEDAATSPTVPSSPRVGDVVIFSRGVVGEDGYVGDGQNNANSNGANNANGSNSNSSSSISSVGVGVGVGVGGDDGNDVGVGTEQKEEDDEIGEGQLNDDAALLGRSRPRRRRTGDRNEDDTIESVSDDDEDDRHPPPPPTYPRYPANVDMDMEDYDPTLAPLDDTVEPLPPPANDEERLAREAELEELTRDLESHSLMSYVILLVSNVIIVTTAVLLGGEGNGSIAGIACGSAVYWTLWALLLPIMVTITVVFAVRARNRYVRKVQLGFPFLRGDVMWTVRSLVIYPFVSFSAGVAAGMIGVGGGTIKAPLLLDLGLLPESTAATVAYMILFTSSCTTSQFLIHGMLQYDYAIWYCILGFFGTILGQILLQRLAKAYNRPSLLIFSIAAVTALGSTMLTVQGSFQLSDDVSHNKHMGFRHICE